MNAPPQPQAKPSFRWALRCLLGAVSLGVVGALSCWTGFALQSLLQSPCGCAPWIPLVQQNHVVEQMARLGKLLQDVHEKTGSAPTNWDELAHAAQSLGWMDRFPAPDRVPMDPWGRALLFDATSEQPRLRCLGRDGKPGGETLDADTEWPRDQSEDFQMRVPTHEERTRSLLSTLATCFGIVAAILCFILPTRERCLTPHGILRAALVRGGLILLVSLLVDCVLVVA